MESLGFNFWPIVDLWPIGRCEFSRDLRSRGTFYRRSALLRWWYRIFLDTGMQDKCYFDKKKKKQERKVYAIVKRIYIFKTYVLT